MIASRSLILSLAILLRISSIESYRILGVFPYNGKSHNVMFNPLMKELARRGHEVHHITHFPQKNVPSNYKVVVNLNGTLKSAANSLTIEKAITRGAAESTGVLLGNELCKLLALDDMQQFIKNLRANPTYDIVITEAFGAHCFMGIGHLLNVPVVALSSAAEYPWISQYIGNYDNLAVNPHILLTSFDINNFWDRLNNFLTYYWHVYEFATLTEDVQTEYMRKYLSPDIPNIREVEKNVALTIVNRHPVINGAKAITSSIIEASGLHIGGNDDVLSESLKKWLDDSDHGVVYFSLGSLILIETLPVDTIKSIYESFAKLAPMKVLMKVADKSKLPPGLPKNVLTLPWIPQQPVLAHSNVRVFLTHGGLMGTQEALYYGVPMIGIPLFADQARNIAALVAKDMAVKLRLDDVTTASLDQALNEVLKNPKYWKSTKFYSKVFQDQPMTSMDRAVFWIEFIIRNGPETLRSPGLKLPWWQTALIDIYGFIFISISIVLALIYRIMKNLSVKCTYTPPRKSTTKSKVQ